MSVSRPRWLPAVAFVAVVSGCVLGAAVVPATGALARAGSPRPWRIVFNTPGAALAVTAPGPVDAWMFGISGGFGKPERPLARHWNGRRWSAVAVHGGLAGGIGCAGASSPRSVWAFNGASLDAGGPGAAALRPAGTGLVISHTFPAGYITDCAVLSAANVWVFGSSHVGLGVGTWHFNGSAWKQIRTPRFYLASASAVSARDIWAAGQDARGNDNVIARWNGRTWQRNRAFSRALPPPGANTQIFGGRVTALSARDVWAETTVVRLNPRRITAIVQHWNGTRWQRVHSGNRGFYLPGAVPDGHGGWWSAGYAASPARPYLLHESGGRWTRVRISIPRGSSLDIFDIVNVPHTRSMLGAGWLTGASTAQRSRAVVLGYGPLPR